MVNETKADAMPRLEFAELAELTAAMDIMAAPAELHGLLCGALASRGDFDEASWLQTAAIWLERDRVEPAQAKTLLLQLYVQSRAELEGTDFEFELLWPEDDASLSVKVEALGDWCAGFLAGFEPSVRQQLSPEAQEALIDFAHISQINPHEDALEADAERDLTELHEYVRMAVILLYTELHTESEALDPPPGSLH